MPENFEKKHGSERKQLWVILGTPCGTRSVAPKQIVATWSVGFAYVVTGKVGDYEAEFLGVESL